MIPSRSGGISRKSRRVLSGYSRTLGSSNQLRLIETKSGAGAQGVMLANGWEKSGRKWGGCPYLFMNMCRL